LLSSMSLTLLFKPSSSIFHICFVLSKHSLHLSFFYSWILLTFFPSFISPSYCHLYFVLTLLALVSSNVHAVTVNIWFYVLDLHQLFSTLYILFTLFTLKFIPLLVPEVSLAHSIPGLFHLSVHSFLDSWGKSSAVPLHCWTKNLALFSHHWHPLAKTSVKPLVSPVL
jgi:hypothetical protein